MQASLQVVVDRVKNRFGESILSVVEFRDEVTIRVTKQDWYDLHQFLRDDSETNFAMMIDETAADYPLRQDRFDVITHLLSLDKRHRLRVKTALNENDEIPSLYPLWKTANWLEREAYDLFGVIFAGHPDLRRILLPENWEGYPLRKDYPVEGYDI
jgi:NADH-quinone oxidoreductase subunit C